MNRTLACTTALGLVLAASASWADVTPEEVWQGWQALATSTGQQITFDDATRTGDTLAVSGVVLTFTDELGGSFSAALDSLSFTDNGDGTVAVTMDDSYPMTMTFPETGEGPTALKFTVLQSGMVTTASGSAPDISYDFTAPSITVKLDEVTGPDGQPVEAEADLVMTGMAGKYMLATEGEQTAFSSSLSAENMTLTLSGKDTEGTGEAKVTLSAADLTATAKGNLLGAEVMANMAAALKSGFATESNFSFGAMTMDADVTDATGPVNITGSLTDGSFDLALDKETIAYNTTATGGKFTVAGPAVSFPEAAFGFAETAFSILMPASKSDTPQDFAVLTKLVDLTMSEDVWGLVDPGATLSREPATFIFDIKGTGFWNQDIMDPTIQADGITPPGELISLDLSQILVKAAGAEVDANGGLTFDNADLVTFGGFPNPSGTINITIKGVNTLIDNLIAIGLLPEDQAMGARMMLGLFARPGAGPDELISLVEFKDGGIFANGQQLQ